MRATLYDKEGYRNKSSSYSSWMLSKSYFFLVEQTLNDETFRYDELYTWTMDTVHAGRYETQGMFNRFSWIAFDDVADATAFKLCFVDSDKKVDLPR